MIHPTKAQSRPALPESSRRPSLQATCPKWTLVVEALLAVAVVLAVVYGLGRGSLQGDEAIYAVLSRSITEKGSWVIMHFNGDPWLEKPPLYMWTSAILMRLFGPSEVTVRLPAALSAMIGICLTYLLGRELFNRAVGILAVLIAVTTPPLLYTSRFGNLDWMLTMWTLASIYFALRAFRRPEFWLACGVACGLAVMTKGAGGAISILSVGVLIATEWRHGWRPGRMTAGGAVLALAVALPWHLAALLQAPDLVWTQYLGRQVVQRVTGQLGGSEGGPFYYFRTLALTYFPWILLLPFALGSAVWAAYRRRDRSFVLLVPIALTFGIFSLLVQTKQDWYILPIYPFSAILISRLIYLWCAARPRIAAAATVIVAVVAVASVGYGPVRVRAERYLGNAYEKPLVPVAVLAASSHDHPAGGGQPLLISSGILTRENYPVAPVFYSNRRVELILVPENAEAYAAKYGSVDLVIDDAGALALTARGGRILTSYQGDDYVRLASAQR